MKKEELEIELKAAQERMESLKVELLKTAGVVDFIQYQMKKDEIPPMNQGEPNAAVQPNS